MTCDLNKNIQCHVWPYFSNRLTNHQIRHQASHKVGCQAWWLHMVLRGCVGMYTLTLPTLSPLRVNLKLQRWNRWTKLFGDNRATCVKALRHHFGTLVRQVMLMQRVMGNSTLWSPLRGLKFANICIWISSMHNCMFLEKANVTFLPRLILLYWAIQYV